MEYEGKSSSQPVTALLVRNVRPDCLNDFEEWVKGINQVVKGFEGYLGTDLIRPRDHSHPEYVIVLRFDDYEHPNNSLEPTRPAGCRDHRETGLGWPSSSARGR